jgi:hypothetical protein
MPLEQHWNRLGTPLSRREKGLLALLGCLVVLSVAGVAAYSLAHRSSTQAGCVTATFAASLGGTTVHKCGAAAREFCRSDGPRNAQVAEACRKQGIATG